MVWKWLSRSWSKALGSKFEVDDVFTPGGIPSVTYVDRGHLRLMTRVQNALRRRYLFVVVSGPTKCGKSVLCKRVLGKARQIVVHGGQVSSAEEFWKHVAHHLRIPSTETSTRTRSWSARGLVEIASGLSSLLKKKLSVDSTVGGQLAEAATFSNVPVLHAVGELQRQDATLVIEDFHYLDTETRRSVIRALKSAVFDGLRVIILAVPHRAFDPTDVEAEVEGRVHHVEIPRWSRDDLLQIVEKGFDALRLTIPRTVQRRICEDGFGNPLLVQEICYELCEARLAAKADPTPMEPGDLAHVYDRVIERKGLARFDRLANLSVGVGAPPKVDLRGGGEEVLSMVLLSAIARLGPRPLINYAELHDSLATIIRGEPPPQAQVAAGLVTMATALSEGGAAPLEWLPTRQELAITDPFLMFYLRWVLRDRRVLVLPPGAIEGAVRIQPDIRVTDDEARSA